MAAILRFISILRRSVLGVFFFLSLTLPGRPQESVTAPRAAITPLQQPRIQERSSAVISYWYGPDYQTPFVADPNTGEAANIAAKRLRLLNLCTPIRLLIVRDAPEDIVTGLGAEADDRDEVIPIADDSQDASATKAYIKNVR